MVVACLCAVAYSAAGDVVVDVAAVGFAAVAIPRQYTTFGCTRYRMSICCYLPWQKPAAAAAAAAAVERVVVVVVVVADVLGDPFVCLLTKVSSHADLDRFLVRCRSRHQYRYNYNSPLHHLAPDSSRAECIPDIRQKKHRRRHPCCC